jgi:hypothetical protein
MVDGFIGPKIPGWRMVNIVSLATHGSYADNVSAESVMHKCVVHFIPQHKQISTRKQNPGFIVQKVYGTY